MRNPNELPGISKAESETAAALAATQGLFAKSTVSSYEAYERKVEEMLKGINLDRLTALIDISIKQITPAKNRDLILLVGRTGAGKSTTLNYLMGSKMILQKRGVRSRLEVASGETVYAKIGHGESETLHPLVVPLDNVSGLAYCDCPGFSDNRTREEKLCSSIGLPMAIKSANAVRGILVVIEYADLTATRGEGFVSLAKTLGTLLNGTKLLGANEEQTKIFNNWFFVFTKVPKEDKVADILTTIEDEKAISSDKLEKLNKEIEQVIQDLAKLLNISKDLLVNSDKEQRNIIIKKAAETTNQEITKKAQQLTERLDSNEAEYQDLVIKLSIYQSILMHKENVFIIRGDEADDRLKILNKIQALQKSASIPKEYFVLDDNKSGEWNVLDKIIQKIAKEGAQLLNEQIRYPAELATLKKYKKLVEKQRADQEQILQKLKSSKFSQDDLKKLCQKVLSMSGELTNHLGKTVEQKQAEKEQLKKELQELDTAEPTRYRHRNLEPVSFENNSLRTVGLVLLLLGSAPLIISAAALTAAGMILALGPVIAAQLLKKSGLNISDETIKKLRHIPVTPGFLLASPGLMGHKKLWLESHHFQYDDIPFINSIERKSNPSVQDPKITFADKDEFGEFAPEWYKELLEEHIGFDLSTEVSNPNQGKYEVIYRDSTKRSAKITAWIELFVEKRLHPDFKPRIEIIKKELERLELSTNNYLKNDLEQLTQKLIEEKNLLKDVLEKKELQSKLREILENRLSQHQKRMEILHGCILGYQAHVKESRDELAKQKSRYVMLAQLAKVIGVNNFAETFLIDYASYLKQKNKAQLNAVWGRKQTPEQQPDYEVHDAKVKGTALGAFFKRCDKPSSFWLGKLSCRLLSSTELPQSTQASRARRGSALESLLEKIAGDLYDYLSNGQYLVPKTRLAELPVENKFTKTHPLTEVLLEDINQGRQPKIGEGVYIMSKYVEDYQDLANLGYEIIYPKNLEEFKRELDDWMQVHKPDDILFIFAPNLNSWKAYLLKEQKIFAEKTIDANSSIGKELQAVNEKNVISYDKTKLTALLKETNLFEGHTPNLNDCIIDGKLFSFKQCLAQRKLPEEVIIENKKIPLKGVVEILAVSRLLADTDALGGGAKNAGFLIERNAEGQPTAARAVKVDPGFAFSFEVSLFLQSYNPHGSSDNLLKQDKRHLQYGNGINLLLWNNLTERQQQQFILALEFGLKMLRDHDAVLKKFVTRKEFEKTPKQRDLSKVEEYLNLEGLQKNLKLQEEVYKKELDELKKSSQHNYFTPSNH